MVMRNNFPSTDGGHDLQHFFQSTHGSVCGTDLSNSSNGGGSAEAKQQVCAKKCYETDECIGYVMNANTCFFKKANFLNTGTHTEQACINAHKKTRLNNTDKYDETGFKYRAGTCGAVPKPMNMNEGQYIGIVGTCPGKLTPEACVRSKFCAWNPVNSNKKYSSYSTNDGISAPGTIAKFSTDDSSGALCDRENAKYCLENLMESTASTSFLATANSEAGNACSTKFNCEPDIWF
jgi:hypothetical protein